MMEGEDLEPESAVTTAELFKALRDSLGLSVRQFAKELHVTHSHISRIERGWAKAGDELLASCEQRFNLASGYLSYCLERMPPEVALPRDAPASGFYWPEEFPEYSFVDGPETIDDLEVHASIDRDCMCGPWEASWTTSFEGRPRRIMYLHLAGECDGLLLGCEIRCDIGVSGHGTQVDPSSDGLFGAHEAISLAREIERGEQVRFALSKSQSSRAQSVKLRPGPGQMIEHVRIKLSMPLEGARGSSSLVVHKSDQTFSGERRSAASDENAIMPTPLYGGSLDADPREDIQVEFERVGHGRVVGLAWKYWNFGE
jgi:transcriptional regulator with XRE-family HTH domain